MTISSAAGAASSAIDEKIFSERKGSKNFLGGAFSPKARIATSCLSFGSTGEKFLEIMS